MKTIHLHGFLAEKFGGPYTLDVSTPKEAVQALSVQLPGFRETIRKGNWHLVRGALDGRDEVDEAGVDLSLGKQSELHIIPAIEGANSGWTNIIIGIILIVVGYFTFGSTTGPGMAMIAAGAGLAVGGIVQLTTKMPGVDDSTKGSTEDRASYLFNGPTNQSTQGVAVPRGYGRLKVGSIVVSAGLFAEQMSA